MSLLIKYVYQISLVVGFEIVRLLRHLDSLFGLPV